jgi:Fic family protein
MNKFRLDLTEDELIVLRAIWSNTKTLNQHNTHYENKDSYITLNEIIQKPKIIVHSDKKIKASASATEARIKKAKEKVDNAINILRMENKKITRYSISKMSGVSYNTIKKYLSDNDITSLNELK